MVRLAVPAVIAAAFVAASHVASAGNIDCEMSVWVPQVCDGTTFLQVFTRTIVKDKQGSGRGCGALTETRPCKKVNCAASAWTPWSLCDVDDYKERTRLVEFSYNGHECPVDRLKCNPTDCLISAWGPWMCVGETKTRRREVLRNQKANGLACPSLVESAPCDPIDCVLDTNWATTTTCDAATGLHIQTRGEAVAAAHGGMACQASDKQRTFPGTCASGYCALVSPGQYGCKPPVEVNGSILLTTSTVSIDYVDFVIDAASVVELDILSMEAINEYNGVAGTTYVDVNGDCSARYIDSSIVLLSVNTDGTNNQIIASNDNAPEGQGLSDGSLSLADSYLSANLQPGRYRVAVGVSTMTTADALAKTMAPTDTPRECDSQGARYGNYRLSISAHESSVTVTSPNSYIGSQCSSLRPYAPNPVCPYHKELPKNIVEGTITRLNSGVSVDYIRFTMPQSGSIIIDLTSYESGYVNVNGYCGSAYMDSYIYLFRALPGATTVAWGDYVSHCDDYGGARVSSTSQSSLDSYLSLSLAAGDYVLAVSSFSFSRNDAVAKINTYGGSISACGYSGRAANYQVKFTTAFDINAIPPGSFAGKYCLDNIGKRSC